MIFRTPLTSTGVMRYTAGVMNTTGIGHLDTVDVIGIILVTLKVIGVEPVAHWPWILVLAPFWIFIAAVAFVALLGRIVKSENEKLNQKEKNSEQEH